MLTTSYYVNGHNLSCRPSIYTFDGLFENKLHKLQLFLLIFFGFIINNVSLFYLFKHSGKCANSEHYGGNDSKLRRTLIGNLAEKAIEAKKE